MDKEKHLSQSDQGGRSIPFRRNPLQLSLLAENDREQGLV
jgi:hypothetical protein